MTAKNTFERRVIVVTTLGCRKMAVDIN
jgi:hypothetical protein